MSKSSKAALNPFDGVAVTGVGIEVPGAAGGINEAMKIDPAEFHHGVETTVAKVRFDEVVKGEPDSGLRRVHVLRAEGATIIDRALVAQALDAQRAKIEAAKDRDAGVQRIRGTVPELDDIDDGLEYDEDGADEPRTIGEGDTPDVGAVTG